MTNGSISKLDATKILSERRLSSPTTASAGSISAIRPPLEHPGFEIPLLAPVERVNGFGDGVQRIEQHEVVVANAKPSPLALNPEDAPAIPDVAATDFETGVVNGPVRHYLERERPGIGKTDVPQFVRSQSGDAFPGNAQGAPIVALDGTAVVTQPNQRPGTGQSARRPFSDGERPVASDPDD